MEPYQIEMSVEKTYTPLVSMRSWHRYQVSQLLHDAPYPGRQKRAQRRTHDSLYEKLTRGSTQGLTVRISQDTPSVFSQTDAREKTLKVSLEAAVLTQVQETYFVQLREKLTAIFGKEVSYAKRPFFNAEESKFKK